MLKVKTPTWKVVFTPGYFLITLEWREKKVTVAKVDTGVSSTNQKVGGSPYCSQHIHLTVYDI